MCTFTNIYFLEFPFSRIFSSRDSTKSLHWSYMQGIVFLICKRAGFVLHIRSTFKHWRWQRLRISCSKHMINTLGYMGMIPISRADWDPKWRDRDVCAIANKLKLCLIAFLANCHCQNTASTVIENEESYLLNQAFETLAPAVEPVTLYGAV